MKEQNALKQVAAMAKIADSYVSAWGDEAKVEDETIRRLLASLGYDTTNDQTLLKSAEKKHKADVLEAVLVIRQGEPLEVLQSQIVRDERAEGGPLVFSLPSDLALGYHKLFVSRKRRKAPYEMTVIVTPTACFKQPALEKGKKLWGPSVQLYTLRTQHNWGIGDFGDLKQLVADIASSSRRWLNILYIDVSSVPEFALSGEAQQKVGSAEFQQRLQKARESHWVNYT